MRIRENEAGGIVLELVPTLRAFRGAATSDSDGTPILADERDRDANRARRLEWD